MAQLIVDPAKKFLQEHSNFPPEITTYITTHNMTVHPRDEEVLSKADEAAEKVKLNSLQLSERVAAEFDSGQMSLYTDSKLRKSDISLKERTEDGVVKEAPAYLKAKAQRQADGSYKVTELLKTKLGERWERQRVSLDLIDQESLYASLADLTFSYFDIKDVAMTPFQQALLKFVVDNGPFLTNYLMTTNNGRVALICMIVLVAYSLAP